MTNGFKSLWSKISEDSKFEQNWTSSFGVIFGSKTAYIYTGYLSSHALFCVRSCKETRRIDERVFITIVETPYLVSAS